MNERNRVPNPLMKGAIFALIAVAIVSVGVLGVGLVLTSVTGGAIYDNGSVQNTPMAAGIVLLACVVGVRSGRCRASSSI